MSIEDLRFSSSSIDDFFAKAPSPRIASSGRMRISSLHDLVGFHRISADKLIRLSQKDFWKVDQDSEGYFIERLVEDTDGPVKG